MNGSRKMCNNFKISTMFKKLALEKFKKNLKKKIIKFIILTKKSLSMLDALLRNFIFSLGKESHCMAMSNGRTTLNPSDLIENDSIAIFFKRGEEIFFRSNLIWIFYKKPKKMSSRIKKSRYKKSFLSIFGRKFVPIKGTYGRENDFKSKIRKKIYIHERERENQNKKAKK